MDADPTCVTVDRDGTRDGGPGGPIVDQPRAHGLHRQSRRSQPVAPRRCSCDERLTNSPLILTGHTVTSSRDSHPQEYFVACVWLRGGSSPVKRRTTMDPAPARTSPSTTTPDPERRTDAAEFRPDVRAARVAAPASAGLLSELEELARDDRLPSRGARGRRRAARRAGVVRDQGTGVPGDQDPQGRYTYLKEPPGRDRRPVRGDEQVADEAEEVVLAQRDQVRRPMR